MSQADSASRVQGSTFSKPLLILSTTLQLLFSCLQLSYLLHKTALFWQNKREYIVKSDNLQNNKLGCWVDRLIDQASDSQSIILMIKNKTVGLLAWTSGIQNSLFLSL